MPAARRPTRRASYRTLWAADRLAAAGMWLTVHMTYADKVHPDGREMVSEGLQRKRLRGHTGGSLNIVPAYVGYLAANALTGLTRGWLMGQGHCGRHRFGQSAGGQHDAPPRRATTAAKRVDTSRATSTATRSTRGRAAGVAAGQPSARTRREDFPRVAISGFAELQYVRIPLRGERLVVFLSDGAFEEQRGGDWAPRWWRARTAASWPRS